MSLLWVDYEIKCTVGRGRFTLDEVLTIPIQYRPQTVAGLGSSYRLQAYETNMPIPGPDIDPAGWRTARTTLQGDFFAQRSVKIICSFSLAEPLAYPRGYPVPFAAELACADAQVVDVLASQKPVVGTTLVRLVAGGDTPDVADIPTSSRSWITHRDRARGRVHIAGELRAPAWLQPSFSFSGIAVEYYIRYVVKAPGLQLGSQPADIAIRICARPAPGPLPVSYVRQLPVLEDAALEAEKSGWDYSEKSGMLASYAVHMPMPRAEDC
ncbi:hypothetical protein AURDEDRAFT_122655 [Auricularia subglabra TFB-10046 SS5]|nr:hypothetical protein AURDEDRAFT_122655 [Auricularia subglabra TFB-10046 SS5]